MTIHHKDDRAQLWHGDCLDVLRGLPDASVDSVVTDPPYGIGFMGKEWDGPGGMLGQMATGHEKRGALAYGGTHSRGYADNDNVAFQQWCEQWAAECLRVLKPGGHMLAFGGTRTWHRLACAIEDAGFEVRDSIAWLYGSGFPKSLDVSKAITTKGGRPEDIRRAAMGDDYTPSGRGRVNYDNGGGSQMNGSTSPIPLTPAAQQWQGWGTALKPAFEPVVVARKPLGGSMNVVAIVEASLRQAGVEGEIRWTASASSAVNGNRPRTSGGTTAPPVAATSARRASSNATGDTAQPTVRCTASQLDAGSETIPSEPARSGGSTPGNCETPSSPPTAPTVSAAVNRKTSSSPSTTSPEAGAHTAELSEVTSTATFASKDSLRVTESFAGTATGLSGSLARVRIDRLTDGIFVWPDDLPTIVTSGSTVAANVLTHGTGALNVDACRVTPSSDYGRSAARADGSTNKGAFFSGDNGGIKSGALPDYASLTGRWPTNVVLDGSQADALDADIGTLKSGANPTRRGSDKFRDAYGDFQGQKECVAHRGADEGGPSRFFPVMRYQAKAPTRERPKSDGVSHPTVKPLELMRWLCRLVTPSGGTILEPFAGSGTTVEAALLEGFRCIAIEREADYLPLILARLERVEPEPQPQPTVRRDGNGRDGEASAERRYTAVGGTNFAMKPGPRYERPSKSKPSAADALALFDFEEPA